MIVTVVSEDEIKRQHAYFKSNVINTTSILALCLTIIIVIRSLHSKE